MHYVDTLRPRLNGRHFPDDILRCINFPERKCMKSRLQFLFKFVPKGPINSIPALAQIMACRYPGDKQLSEPMMIGFLTHIYVIRPQLVNLRDNWSK